MHSINKILILLSIVCILIVIGLYLFNIQPLIVTSDSMKPTFSTYDVLLAKSQEYYQVGDIISFLTKGSVVTHRVVNISSVGFITRGDSNASADSAVILNDQVIGRVIAIIPKVGHILLLLRSPQVMIFFLALLFFNLWKKVKTNLHIV